MNWRLVGILIVLYFIYLILGAVAFMFMERDFERKRCEEAKYAKSLWLNLTVKNQGFTLTDLNGFIENVTKFSRFGISLVGDVKCPSNWNFESSFFFSGTIVTTIGYGRLAPTLWYSQLFCIFYALIGIPLFATMFAGIGENLYDIIEKGLKKCNDSVRTDQSNTTLIARYLLIFLFIGGGSVVFFHIIPAAIFTHVEGWTYFESLYYCFITLTTIGFGDFVAGRNPKLHYIAIYRVMVYFWILFGLAYTFTAINILVRAIRHTVRTSKHINEGLEALEDFGDDARSDVASLLNISDGDSSSGEENGTGVGEVDNANGDTTDNSDLLANPWDGDDLMELMK